MWDTDTLIFYFLIRFKLEFLKSDSVNDNKNKEQFSNMHWVFNQEDFNKIITQISGWNRPLQKEKVCKTGGHSESWTDC